VLDRTTRNGRSSGFKERVSRWYSQLRAFARPAQPLSEVRKQESCSRFCPAAADPGASW